jgi:hypothetical protein
MAEDLRAAHERLFREATDLAGSLSDLAQRAMVYHHVFQASGRNHAFPLIAAHGALWAGGHFRAGLRLGRWLSWQYGWNPRLRRRRLEQLANFADALREINRKVCVDTYVNFYFTMRYGGHHRASDFVPPRLLDALATVHEARRLRQRLDTGRLRAVFEAHFLHEQETVVTDTIQRAAAAFDWPLVKFLALRPPVGFAYLPDNQPIRFHDFADRQERIQNGLLAFDLAARVGWDKVERTLTDYGLLPTDFSVDPVMHFSRMRKRILGGFLAADNQNLESLTSSGRRGDSVPTLRTAVGS